MRITRKGAFDMVRLGIGLYGVSDRKHAKAALNPVFGWKSVVSQVKSVEKDESIGYGRVFKADKATRYAVIPIGYRLDGFKRLLGGGTRVLLLTVLFVQP